VQFSSVFFECTSWCKLAYVDILTPPSGAWVRSTFSCEGRCLLRLHQSSSEVVTFSLAKKSTRHLPVWSAIFAVGIICDVLNCGGPATPTSLWPSSMRCSDVRLTRQSEHTASRPTASSSLTSSNIIAVGDNLQHHRRGALTSDRTLPGVWHVSWSTPRHIPRHHHRWRRSSSPDQRLHHHRRGHLRRGALTSNRTLPGVWLVSLSTPRQGARHHRHLLSSQTSSTVIADVIYSHRRRHLLSSQTSSTVITDVIYSHRRRHLQSSQMSSTVIAEVIYWRGRRLLRRCRGSRGSTPMSWSFSTPSSRLTAALHCDVTTPYEASSKASSMAKYQNDDELLI